MALKRFDGLRARVRGAAVGLKLDVIEAHGTACMDQVARAFRSGALRFSDRCPFEGEPSAHYLGRSSRIGDLPAHEMYIQDRRLFVKVTEGPAPQWAEVGPAPDKSKYADQVVQQKAAHIAEQGHDALERFVGRMIGGKA